MKKKYEHSERKGLPGGPNEIFSYVTGVFSEDGYKSYSSDVNNPFNIIDSGRITMEDVEFPVMGIDNLGNSEIMMPDGEYEFPGDMVFEIPMAQKGGAYKATSPEDYAFRMQMLSDSLALHQLGEEHYDEFMKAFGDLPYEDNRQPGKPYIDPFKMGKRYNQEKQRELFPKYMEWRRENRGFKDFFTENPALGVFKPDRVNLSLQKADGDKIVYEEDIRPQISQTVMNMMIEPNSFIGVSTRPLQTNRPLEYDPNLTGEFKKTFTRSDGSTYDEYIYHLKDNNPYHVRRYQKPTQEVLPPDDMRNPEDWDKYLPDLPVSNTLKKLVPKKPTLSAEEIEKRRKAEELRIKKEEELKKQKELETTISNTEKAFKAKRDLEQQIAEDKYMMQNPDIPDGYQLVQGYRDPLYGKTIGDKYVYMGPSSDNKPDIPVGPTLEDYQIWKNTQTQNPSKYTKLSGTFQKGGNVSWNFKGKTYSGTLIPSMEDANNRYARTHNGKIKTLPKAQYGLEKLPELQGGGFKKRKYTNTRVPKQRQQRLRNFFESIGEKIQDRRDSRQMIPEESALQEEKVLPTYNLPDTETLSKGDVNIKKGADDRVAFLTSPIYYENAVNTYGSEEEAQKVIQNQLNRIGDVDVILPGTGDSDPQEGGAAAYFDPKTNTIGYADMFKDDTGLQHLTTHELDHKSAVQGTNPDGSPMLYPEFTMYNELDLSNKSDLKDYNYNFQNPGDVILNDRGYLTDEELKQRTKDYHSYLQNPAEFRERLNAVKQYMVKNNFNYMDATGDEIIDYMYNIPQIGDTPGEGSLSVDDIERASKEGLY